MPSKERLLSVDLSLFFFAAGSFDVLLITVTITFCNFICNNNRIFCTFFVFFIQTTSLKTLGWSKNKFSDFFKFENMGLQMECSASFVLFTKYTSLTGGSETHCTIDQLGEGCTATRLVLDFSKAFDCLNYDHLLH